jgi:hypothetical protein
MPPREIRFVQNWIWKIVSEQLSTSNGASSTPTPGPLTRMNTFSDLTSGDVSAPHPGGR